MDPSALKLLFSLAGSVACGAAASTYGVHGRSAQLFGPSVCCGDSGRRSVALTFDDGPSPGSVGIAEYLALQGVPATFFQCGANVLRHPEIARELVAAGHEIGNHTFSHARLCPRLGWQPNLLSAEAIYQEFARAQEAIVQATGAVPHLLRAPYGLKWLGMGAAQRRLGLLGVMWSVIGHDWEWDPAQVAAHVLAGISAGAIVCLHDGRDTRVDPDVSVTLLALRRIVPELKAQGYSFETVSRLLVP